MLIISAFQQWQLVIQRLKRIEDIQSDHLDIESFCKKIFLNLLTNEFCCAIIQNISCEEDTQRIANVSREPTAGVSR